MNIFKKLVSFSLLKPLILLMISMVMLTSCKNPKTSCDVIEDIKGSDITCEEYKATQQKECWQSSMLEVLYDSMSKITMDAYNNLTRGALGAMMVLFCLWFAFYMFKYYASFEKEKNTDALWTDVLKKFFLCFICGYIASSSNTLLFFLNNLIFPVFNAFLELASHMLQLTTLEVKTMNTTLFGEPYEASSGEICSILSQTNQGVTTNGFPAGPKNMMQCLICNVSDKLNMGFSLAFTIMGTGILLAQIIGFTILVLFTFVKITFVFYLADTLFKFTMMIIILPLLILAYPFEQTRKWLSEGVKIILSGAAYLLAVSVLCSLSILAIVSLIIENQDIFNAPLADVANFSPVFLVLLMIAFLMQKIMDISSKLTNIFIGTSVTSKFQEEFRAVVGFVGTALATLLTGGIGGKVMEVITKAQNASQAAQTSKDKIDNSTNDAQTASSDSSQKKS